MVAQLEIPERERRRSPEHERLTVAVGAASVWAADVHRSARDFVRRHGDGVVVTVTLGDGAQLRVRNLRAGPGDTHVTLLLGDRELAVRVDAVTSLELARADGADDSFRVRAAPLGFA